MILMIKELYWLTLLYLLCMFLMIYLINLLDKWVRYFRIFIAQIQLDLTDIVIRTPHVLTLTLKLHFLLVQNINLSVWVLIGLWFPAMKLATAHQLVTWPFSNNPISKCKTGSSATYSCKNTIPSTTPPPSITATSKSASAKQRQQNLQLKAKPKTTVNK